MENTGERTVPDQENIYEFERIYSLVSELYGNEERTILDYGCGTGYGTYMLAKHFGRCFGVDVSSEAIEFCKSSFASDNLSYHLLNPSVQPFPNDFFDCIFSFQVFEHVPLDSVEQYFKNIFNMLKPGGGIITTPNANNYTGGHSGNKFHVKEYTRQELEQLLRQTLPEAVVRIGIVEDVLSTRVFLRIIKTFGYNLFSRVLLKLVYMPLRIMERHKLLDTSHKRMLACPGHDGMFGSYYVEITKSESRLIRRMHAPALRALRTSR